MNTKSFVLCCFLTLYGQAYCQVAKWLIEPKYEHIFKERYANVLRAQSADSTTIWSMNGEKLIATKNYVAPFNEGVAVATKYSGNIPTTTITGIYTDKGKYNKIVGDYALLDNVQMFMSGYLLVKDRQNGNLFRYMLPSGNVGDEIFIEARPYQNGYASCETYEKWEKKKGRCYVLLNQDMRHVKMAYNGKDFDTDDISFISSVNDEDIGIVVANEKVFYFSGKSRSLTPLYASEQEQNAKNQAEVKGVLLSTNDRGETILQARTHKTDEEVVIVFDDFLAPMSIKSSKMERLFKKREHSKWNPNTSLICTLEQDLYGIMYHDSIEVFPPQFKKVETYDDNAIVVLQNGKSGVLQVLGDKHFSLKLNDGEDIPFKHQRFKTVACLDMPKEISPEKVRMILASETGCSIDERSADRRVTEAGNRVQYNCTLSFPNTLPDEKRFDESNKLSYPVQIQYHGLMSPVMSLEAYAWHYKYFSIEPGEVQVSSNGTATFPLTISIPSSEDQNYSLQLDIASSDTLVTEITSFNVFSHKCTVSTLKEGVNNIEIIVREDGCPPISFPFELSYTKPVPRKRESGKVNIQQKTKNVRIPFRPKT